MWKSLKLALAFLGWVCVSLHATESFVADVDPIYELPDSNVPQKTQAQTELAATVKSIYKERLLEVDINGQQLDEVVMLLEAPNGQLYLWGEVLRSWRLRTPASITGIVYQGETYYPLDAISDVTPIYDPLKSTLKIQFEPQAFNMTQRTPRFDNLPQPTKSTPGGFVNYDLFTSSSAGLAQHSAQFELGYFNQYGVGTNSILLQNSDRDSQMVRLDTAWTMDIPENMQTLRLGDVVSAPGTWGRSVRFGGIQFGTNFGTQPGFITYPMRSVRGQAILPSTVDVFINNSLVSRQNVPPGPFTINNLPVISGSGEVNLKVKDLFGREQIIVQPFYSSQALLGKGLDNFSYDLGWLRSNYGINSNDYNAWLVSQNYRRGISDYFTGELHTELMADHLTAGFGGDYLIPQIGTLSTYVAASHSKTGANSSTQPIESTDSSLTIANSSKNSSTTNGALLLLGLDRFSQSWSMGLRSQWASTGFTEAGQLVSQFSPANQVTANLSYTTKRSGSVNVAFVSQINRDLPSSKLVTLGYGVSLGRLGSLSISALRDLEGLDTGTTIYTMLSIPLGVMTSSSLSAQSRRGGSGSISGNGSGNTNDFVASIQKNVPSGEGYGYFLQTRSGGSSQASFTQQTYIGNYTAAAADYLGITSTSFDVNGGIAILGSDIFMSRRVDQSFAVARVPDYPNITVLADNQPAGRTDQRGTALIPRLRAYDKNEISIDPTDLPLDAKILGVKVEAVPYYRSGIQVNFPVSRSNAAIFTLNTENGTPVPTGATVKIDTKEEVFRVGDDGEVYVQNLSAITYLHASWRKQSCEFEVNYVASNDPLPNLGIIICRKKNQ